MLPPPDRRSPVAELMGGIVAGLLMGAAFYAAAIERPVFALFLWLLAVALVLALAARF